MIKERTMGGQFCFSIAKNLAPVVHPIAPHLASKSLRTTRASLLMSQMDEIDNLYPMHGIIQPAS
jgi:hypothetical protein